MRRLTLLIAAFVVALLAVRLMAGDTELALYVLRDGLLIATVAAILFAIQSSSPLQLLPRGIVYAWPTIGRALWGAGIASVSASAMLTFYVDGSAFSDSLRVGLWLVGLLLIGVGALWRGRVLSYAAPTYRWQRATGGDEEQPDGAAMVRVPVDNAPVTITPRPSGLSELSSGFGLWVGVGVMLAVGAFLRLWKLASIPASCVGSECADALQLTHASGSLFDPFSAIALALLSATGDAVLSLRLTAAIFGVITLLFVFLTLKRLVNAESALIGAWLLALSSWHIGAGRTSSPETATVFFIVLSLWVLLQTLASRDRRWWVAAGLPLGALAVAEPGLAPAISLWAILIGVIVCVQQRRFYTPALLFVATTFAILLTPFFQQTNIVADAQLALSTGLPLGLPLDAFLSSIGSFGDLSLTNWLTVALALLGLGYIVRYLLRMSMALLLAGLLPIALILFAQIDPSQQALAGLLLPLLPFGIVAAALAVDQMLTGTVEVWRPLVRPAYFVTASLLLVALTGAASVGALWEGLSEGGVAANETADAAMLAYLETTVDDRSIVYVPPTLFDNPALQLHGAEWLESGRVLPLSSVEDVLFSGGDSTVQRFLIRGNDRTLLDLLMAYFPHSSADPHFDEEKGQLAFYAFTVAAEDRLWPGLVGSYFSDTLEPELLMDRRDGPLAFDWTQSFSPEPPFVAEWQGTLRVPESGAYRLAVDGATAAEGEGIGDVGNSSFTLLLDNRVVLDSSLGVLEMAELLAEGLYQIEMRYESGDAPSPLSVRWHRPDGISEVIPRDLLVTRTLPDLGLMGTYFQGRSFRSPEQIRRKDLRFDQPPDQPSDLPDAYSVRWTGKLAANRAGEYLLATLGNGYSRLLIDDQLLIENEQDGDSPGEGSEKKTGYAEGLVYLEEGWHAIQVDFSPTIASSTFQLLWQPPGSFPGLLPSLYLRPVGAETEPVDLAMPQPPALTDPRLGTDDFALSKAAAKQQAAIVLPPQNLPPLALEQLWTAGSSCGAGENQLNGPHGVVLDGETSRIYVADSGNQRIAVFDLDGNPFLPIDGDQFEEPHDVDIDQSGALIVLDSVGAPLQILDTETGTSTALSIDTSFYRPRGLSISRSGELYISDTGGGRIVVLTPDGKTLAIYGGAGTSIARGQPVDAIATERSLWAIAAEDGRLWDLNTEGSMSAIERTSTLDGPQLAEMVDGTFFLSDPARQTIFYHRVDGRPMAQFAYVGVLEQPTGIDAELIDGQIHLVVVDTGQCRVSLWKALF